MLEGGHELMGLQDALIQPDGDFSDDAGVGVKQFKGEWSHK